MKKTNKTDRISALAIFSGSLLVATSAVLTFAPVIRTNAAEESVDVTVTVNPIVSLSLDKNALNFNITPTSAGVFDSGLIVATVDTNSTGGYELYFSSEDSSTSMTSLVSESTIASDFNSAVTSSSMLANKWGYSTDATNFNKIPALADQAKIKDLNHVPASSEKDTTVTIGIKIDSTLPSGTYSKKVVFSAIAHPSAVPPLHGISTMQQMTSEVCAATTTPLASAARFDWDGSHHDDNTYVPRKSLKDTRDDKYYLVSKLADGNCWMSQNLEFNLDSTKALTNETTDLNTKTSWTPENSTLTEVPTSSTWYTSSSSAASTSFSYYSIASDRYYQGGTEKSSTPTVSDTEHDWEKAGTFYNWYSATAGSGVQNMTNGAIAGDSICPKGWRLPLGPTGDKSWYNLIVTAYGSTPASMISSPLNLVRAGYYDYGQHRMSNQGSVEILWTATSNQNGAADTLYFNASSIEPENHRTKGSGQNVRCVAR
jgi:uncharacterized protein (TIGR02145 family)